MIVCSGGNHRELRRVQQFLICSGVRDALRESFHLGWDLKTSGKESNLLEAGKNLKTRAAQELLLLPLLLPPLPQAWILTVIRFCGPNLGHVQSGELEMRLS